METQAPYIAGNSTVPTSLDAIKQAAVSGSRSHFTVDEMRTVLNELERLQGLLSANTQEQTIIDRAA